MLVKGIDQYRTSKTGVRIGHFPETRHNWEAPNFEIPANSVEGFVLARGPQKKKLNQWTARMQRFAGSNLSIAQFCELEGVSQASFYSWKAKLPQQSVPMIVEPSKPLKQEPRQHNRASQNVVIRLANGIEFEFGGDEKVMNSVLDRLVSRSFSSHPS